MRDFLCDFVVVLSSLEKTEEVLFLTLPHNFQSCAWKLMNTARAFFTTNNHKIKNKYV